jgi:hydrogenase nickel incorporation protein HypA/HybF
MHEYSIVQALVDRVEREARLHAASAVRTVSVRIGTLAGVERELLKTAYDTFRPGTICAEAELEIASLDARWECSRCATPIATGERLMCAACGVPARLVQGDEILLDRIELEVA